VPSRDRVGRVGHSARILRPSHPVGLGNLPDPRVRVGRVETRPDGHAKKFAIKKTKRLKVT